METFTSSPYHLWSTYSPLKPPYGLAQPPFRILGFGLSKQSAEKSYSPYLGRMKLQGYSLLHHVKLTQSGCQCHLQRSVVAAVGRAGRARVAKDRRLALKRKNARRAGQLSTGVHTQLAKDNLLEYQAKVYLCGRLFRDPIVGHPWTQAMVKTLTPHTKWEFGNIPISATDAEGRSLARYQQGDWISIEGALSPYRRATGDYAMSITVERILEGEPAIRPSEPAPDLSLDCGKRRVRDCTTRFCTKHRQDCGDDFGCELIELAGNYCTKHMQQFGLSQQ